jgi:hypothetical protein
MVYLGYEMEAAQSESWASSTDALQSGTAILTEAPLGCARIQCAASEAAGQARLVTWLCDVVLRRKPRSGT